jgi:hypothetical protein
MNIEKIEINGHYVWVDKDAEIKEGDYVYVNCSEIKVTEICQVSGYYNEQFLFKHNSQIHMDYCKKIIAASPELNLEGVPTYVEWLARKEFPNNGTQESGYLAGGFVIGYQTAEKELIGESLNKYQEGFAKALKLCNGSDFINDAERNRAIDFAKWISCSYSFGNISGLWSFHENTSKQYTEEELYELYFEQFKQSKL